MQIMAHNTNQIIKKFVSYNHVSNFKYISGRHVAVIVSRIEVIFECPDSSSGEGHCVSILNAGHLTLTVPVTSLECK